MQQHQAEAKHNEAKELQARYDENKATIAIDAETAELERAVEAQISAEILEAEESAREAVLQEEQAAVEAIDDEALMSYARLPSWSRGGGEDDCVG